MVALAHLQKAITLDPSLGLPNSPAIVASPPATKKKKKEREKERPGVIMQKAPPGLHQGDRRLLYHRLSVRRSFSPIAHIES